MIYRPDHNCDTSAVRNLHVLDEQGSYSLYILSIVLSDVDTSGVTANAKTVLLLVN